MRQKFAWTEQALALLGTGTDKDVGEQLGLHHITVRKKRRELNIPKYDSYKDFPIGQVPDSVIAGMKGVKAYQKQRKWTDEQIALLGTASDAAVGRLVGRGKMAVYTARRSRGIPAHRPQYIQKKNPSTKINKAIDEPMLMACHSGDDRQADWIGAK